MVKMIPKINGGTGKITFCFLIFLFCFLFSAAVYPETIYTKDGKVIQAKITKKTATAIWYELASGDIIEYVGINIVDVKKILNDDGSVSKYSPGYGH